MEYKPGQIFEDKDHKLHCEKDIRFCYLLLSQDKEKEFGNKLYWKCAVFMNYEHGAFIRFLNEEELPPLYYIGHIKCNL